MGCSHAGGCPLFPLLNASLESWREYYCDSEDRWRDCARYRLALNGELVPISLLPNGRDAGHLRREADAYWSAVDRRQAHGQPAPPRQDPWSAGAAPWFEPAPPPAVVPSRPRPSPGPRATYQAAPGQYPPGRYPPVQGQYAPEQYAQQAEPKRGWWARLVDWMRGPV